MATKREMADEILWGFVGEVRHRVHTRTEVDEGDLAIDVLDRIAVYLSGYSHPNQIHRWHMASDEHREASYWDAVTLMEIIGKGAVAWITPAMEKRLAERGWTEGRIESTRRLQNTIPLTILTPLPRPDGK